ncbi:flagellar hook capping FlgD N-terminal domain-containing protein [Paenibacillus abyssi]|uniref:Flagellar hook capping protein n=1 Tax=Paenibacillus abyssi TaxID=1340531 RepID=A0A917D842_9BACL|nr:flagellar hook capping FlgD N-terminal domain-containing protein [Paenibacillus abyssi]GGG12377.1 flagellar hook capping protein [Paenibacillus abyssi]
MAGDMISTKSVWPNYNQSNVQAAAKPKDNTLGKDDFLKILVTQLRHQDPMQPLQDREFIAQMAQFSSVEQLMNMASEITLMRHNLGTASNMIGKTIEWMDVNGAGQNVLNSGTVDAIVVTDGVQYASVGEKTIPVDKILSISVKGGEEAT